MQSFTNSRRFLINKTQDLHIVQKSICNISVVFHHLGFLAIAYFRACSAGVLNILLPKFNLPLRFSKYVALASYMIIVRGCVTSYLGIIPACCKASSDSRYVRPTFVAGYVEHLLAGRLQQTKAYLLDHQGSLNIELQLIVYPEVT